MRVADLRRGEKERLEEGKREIRIRESWIWVYIGKIGSGRFSFVFNPKTESRSDFGFHRNAKQDPTQLDLNPKFRAVSGWVFGWVGFFG